MKAKYFAVLLPMGMSIFPGLLASQDANRVNSFYEKEFGRSEVGPQGSNGLNREGKSQGTSPNSSTTTKKDSTSKKTDPSTGQEAPGVDDRANPTTKQLRDRLRQLNQQYQEELQTLMDKTSETQSPNSETPAGSFQENARINPSLKKKSPKPLDQDFQVHDWPKLPTSKEPANSNNSQDSDGFSGAPGQRRSQEKGRVVYPAEYVSPKEVPGGTGTIQRANGTQSNLRNDENLVQTQGNNYQGNGYPNNQQPPRQVIRTQPAVPNYADNGQGTPRRSTSNPIQNSGDPGRNRQGQNNAPDPFQKDMEILKSRYLEDLRLLNQRYQEEAAFLVTGQPVIRPVGTVTRNGSNTPNPGQQVQRGNVIAGNDPLIKPSKTIETSWFPRMFSYFKPTLPFARVSSGNSAGETRMVQVETRNGTPGNTPVKQTSYLPSLAQPDTKKNGQGRPNSRPNTQGQNQQGQYTPGQGDYQSGDYAPSQRDQGYPNQNPQRGRVNENYYQPNQGNNRQGNNGNFQDNGYPNRPSNPGYNQPAPRGPYSGNFPADDTNYRPDPRMVPVQNQNYQGTEDYPVRPANAPGNSPRGYSGGDEPERMPPGVPVQMSEKEKLRQAIEQLQRKYQDDLKSLLNSPPPHQDPEDEVYLPPENEERSSPPVKAARTGGNGSRPQPGWAQQRQRSAEEFLEFLQVNSPGVPNWATESDHQKPIGNKKAPSKDGVAQTNPDRKNGSRKNPRTEPIDEDLDQNP